MRLERHRHTDGYLAVACVSLPAMPLRMGWSAHRDDCAAVGATVLNLPLPFGIEEHAGRVADVDAVARLADTDAIAAAALACDGMLAVDAGIWDWPDMLAADLAALSDLPLAAWADRHGIAATSLSRGFAAAYGVSPKRFKLEQRTRRALRELSLWNGTIAGLAGGGGRFR